MPTNLSDKNVATKENIRKKISHAWAANRHKITNISIPKESWLPENYNPINEFVSRFRGLGGKYIPSSRANFLSDLKKIIQNKHYLTVLNTSQYLTDFLKQHEIRYTEVKPFMDDADVAIVHASALIALSGSLLLSNVKSHYPSVKNLAKHLIVIAFEENIVATMSEALTLQQQNGMGEGAVYEILTPRQLASYDAYSAKEPLIILLLIKDMPNA